MWVDVRHPSTNRLLFRYDPARELVEVAERGESTVIDLTRYQGAYQPVAAGVPTQPAERVPGHGPGGTESYPSGRNRRGPIR